MPTLFRLFGLRFFFYSNEHLPLHVSNADGEAKFTVDPVKLIKNYGLKQKDIKLAESILEENKDLIILRWNAFFKEN